MHEFGQYELKIPIKGWKSYNQASAGIIIKLLEGFASLLSHTTNNILLIFKSYPLNIFPLNFYFYTKIPTFMTMKIEVLFGIVRIYCSFDLLCYGALQVKLILVKIVFNNQLLYFQKVVSLSKKNVCPS